MDKRHFISHYFSLEEAQFSSIAARHGIDNILPDNLFLSVEKTAKSMDGVRELLHNPIRVDSWYRCAELNKLVGSKPTSQHIIGEAVDFICPKFGTPQEICIAIKASPLDFDKLILEYSWVHISFSANPARPNKRLVYTIDKLGNYIPWSN